MTWLYQGWSIRGRQNQRSSSSASCERFDFIMSTACFQRRDMTSGASFEYRIKAATMSLLPSRRTALEFTHISMIIWKTSPLRIIQYWRRGRFFNDLPGLISIENYLPCRWKTDIVLGKPHVCLLLLPEKENVEILHQRYKHVGDILQYF